MGVAKPPDCSDLKHRNLNHTVGQRSVFESYDRRRFFVFHRQVPVTTAATVTTTTTTTTKSYAMVSLCWLWWLINAVVCCVGTAIVVRRLLVPWSYWLGRRALCWCRYALSRGHADIGPRQQRAPPACRCCGGLNFDGMAGSWAGKP